MDPKIAPEEIFASLIEGIRSELTQHQFGTWFGRMQLVSTEGLHFQFSVENSFVRDWIESYYRDLMQRLLTSLTSKSARFELVIHDGSRADTANHNERPRAARTNNATPAPSAPAADVDGTSPAQARPAQAPARPDPPRRPSDTGERRGYGGGRGRSRSPARSDRRRKYEERFQLFGHSRYRNFRSDVILNEDYRFENFVVGPSNHLPHAAALAVANAPGNAYNPLFLHGAVGLGKTHLLQGICASVLAKRPDARILYLSCETFVNQFIAAVEAGELSDFRYRYRHVDMLLIDDIHFLARKERTQEEFFHTFNTLYNSRKQIILSCDSPPREIPTLEDRLVSRFKWGLVAQIEQPDHETRVSIVRRKAERRRIELPEEICQLIADHISTNVRELEGAVLRVIGYASLTNKPLTLDLATEALRDVIQHAERKITIESIIRNVCEHFGVKASELIGKRRYKSISRPRQICMYLCRRLTDYSLVEIGGQIGGRDHTTVIYANDKIAREVQTNPRLHEDLDILTRRIRSGQ